jgi:hypothetical protein
MGMPMLDLCRRGFANVFDRHIEDQRLTRERMIGIYRNLVVRDIDHDHHARPLCGLGFESRAGFDFLDAGKLLSRHGLDKLGIFLAVAVFGRDGGVDLVAGRLAFESSFEAGDDVAGAMKI